VPPCARTIVTFDQRRTFKRCRSNSCNKASAFLMPATWPNLIERLPPYGFEFLAEFPPDGFDLLLELPPRNFDFAFELPGPHLRPRRSSSECDHQ
jgi:hypothetical protein